MRHEWVNTDKPARYGLLRRKRGYVRQGICKRCGVRVKVKAPFKWALDYTGIMAKLGLDCPTATNVERTDGYQSRD